jgi:hypothetical protein
MQRIIDVTTSERIVMDVSELLSHHLIAVNLLRMTALLPKLMRSISFVSRTIEFQLLELRVIVVNRKPIDDLSRGERFEVTYLFADVWRTSNEMYVVLHDDVSEQHNSPLVL